MGAAHFCHLAIKNGSSAILSSREGQNRSRVGAFYCAPGSAILYPLFYPLVENIQLSVREMMRFSRFT
jgi:hypothetical protein